MTGSMTIPAHVDSTVLNLAGMACVLSGHSDERPPLVFLHGLTFDHRIWQPVLEALQRVDPDRQTLIFDLPGHGASRNQVPHSGEHITWLIREAIVAADLDDPVLIGHSISGGLVSRYAARYPSRGVINLDASPDLAVVATLLQSMAEQIRGNQFEQVWALMQQSFRTDLLASNARDLVAANSQPRQDLVLGYWAELLEHSPEQLTADVIIDMRALAATRVPYLLIAGSELSPHARGLMKQQIPGARVEVWAGSGHFPHLAHLDRFVERLATTGRW